jgi:hypothetical protein
MGFIGGDKPRHTKVLTTADMAVKLLYALPISF